MGRFYIPPRSGSHKQARQAAAIAAAIADALAGAEGEGPRSPVAPVPFNVDSDVVTLDGAGAGLVLLPRPGYVLPGMAWEVQRLRVFIAGGRAANPAATATIHLGAAQAQNALDSSLNAGEDTAEYPTPIIVNAGEMVTVAFAAGLAGAVARATIQGVAYRLDEVPQ